jgi:hypothetical protein
MREALGSEFDFWNLKTFGPSQIQFFLYFLARFYSGGFLKKTATYFFSYFLVQFAISKRLENHQYMNIFSSGS